MNISVAQKLGLCGFGLVVAIATFTHRPEMQKAIAMPASTLTQAGTSASGVFVSDAHPTAGNARIVEANGQRYLELDESFRSDAGPDLLVLLHQEAIPESYDSDNYLNLGPMQRTAGAQRYAIPADADLQSFKSAVIWCREFDVTFGYATL